jgi:heptosyltransferase III
VKRVGVMCSPALGDTLLFSGVLRDLRAWCDDQAGDRVEIVHFYMKQNQAAAELVAGADRRVLVDLTSPVESISRIRAENVDVLLDFTSWQRVTALYSLLGKARFTAGFRTAGQHRGAGYDVTADHRADCHEIENFRGLLRRVGIAAGSEPQVVVPVPDVEPLATSTDVVVFHLWASGARSWLREWPEERWIALAERLAGPETVFAITGAPGDRERIEPFVSRMRLAGLNCVPLAGVDGFVSLARVLLRARLVVSVNTGVMHLAAVLGAPTVSLNGPTNNERWGPVGPFGLGVQPLGEGCGYLNLGFEFDGQATDCMERISVEMALAGANEVMRRKSEAMRNRELVSPMERADGN